jgi:hypothetical protein
MKRNVVKSYVKMFCLNLSDESEEFNSLKNNPLVEVYLQDQNWDMHGNYRIVAAKNSQDEDD